MRDKALQLLSLICRLVDIGKSITTDRLYFERDKLIHEVDRSERSSFTFASHMDSQKEDEKRGKAMSDTNDMTEQLSAVPDTVDKVHGPNTLRLDALCVGRFRRSSELQCHAQRYHICSYRQFADAVETSEVHEFHQC